MLKKSKDVKINKPCLITPCIKFTLTKKIGLIFNAPPYHSTYTLTRLIIFHQLKEQLYSNLLHMLMNQLSDGIGNWSTKWSRQNRPAREALEAVNCFTIYVDMQAFITY